MAEIPPTERRNPRSMELDSLDALGVVDLLGAEERYALQAVRSVRHALADAATRIAAAFGAGHTTAYVGAGTSGHLALLDAAEVGATYGIEAVHFRAFICTRSFTGRAVISEDEDDTASGPAALDRVGMGSGDVVVGVAASGTTPFVVATLEHARDLGCTTNALANNPGTALLDVADLPVFLDTGPEVVAGSTRMKAGTAQKIALNHMSTTAMVLAGRVMSNLMVEVRPGPAKLKDRCIRTVVELTGVGTDVARSCLERNDWSIRTSVGELMDR